VFVLFSLCAQLLQGITGRGLGLKIILGYPQHRKSPSPHFPTKIANVAESRSPFYALSRFLNPAKTWPPPADDHKQCLEHTFASRIDLLPPLLHSAP